MGVTIGNINLSECYVGSSKVVSIYVGDIKVWPVRYSILYTSTDGNIVTPSSAATWGNCSIVSNVYKDGQGIIEFDGELKTVGDHSFQSCNNLKTIIIPDSVENIGGNAFNTKNIETIILGKGVKKIGPVVYGGMSFKRENEKLRNIYCYAPNAPQIDDDTFFCMNLRNDGLTRTLHYPKGSDYSEWLRADSYYLGHYKWIGKELE